VNRVREMAPWALLSLAIAGCSIDEPTSRSAPLQPDDYYESQAAADADLARFESDKTVMPALDKLEASLVAGRP